MSKEVPLHKLHAHTLGIVFQFASLEICRSWGIVNHEIHNVWVKLIAFRKTNTLINSAKKVQQQLFDMQYLSTCSRKRAWFFDLYDEMAQIEYEQRLRDSLFPRNERFELPEWHYWRWHERCEWDTTEHAAMVILLRKKIEDAREEVHHPSLFTVTGIPARQRIYKSYRAMRLEYEQLEKLLEVWRTMNKLSAAIALEYRPTNFLKRKAEDSIAQK